MPRRWVRHQLPVMVCVDISETGEREEVTKVVLGAEAEDLQLATDLDGHNLVYDENMERVSVDEFYSRQALTVAADVAHWPARDDWEEGPDALRDPWLYEDSGIPEEDDEGDLELADSLEGGLQEDDEAGEVTAAGDPAGRPAR